MWGLSKKYSRLPWDSRGAGDGKMARNRYNHLLNVSLRKKSPRGPTTALAFIMFASSPGGIYAMGSGGAKEPVVPFERDVGKARHPRY